jgi:DNA mismatch repair protein MutL
VEGVSSSDGGGASFAAHLEGGSSGSKEADSSKASSFSQGGAAQESREEVPSERGFFSSLRYIGQFSQMYLIFEYQDRLILLDQHAAHERINYERLLADFVKETIPRQSFLIPKRIELSLLQAQQAVQYEGDLAHLGIVLEPFGGQIFIVQTMPAFLKDSDPHPLVVELLEEIAQGYKTASLDQRRDAMLMRMACHGSVRGAHRLSAEEVRALMKQLDEIAFRGNCPHGRPIFFEMERAEIEKRFHRT